jgi:hypothetical protein
MLARRVRRAFRVCSRCAYARRFVPFPRTFLLFLWLKWYCTCRLHSYR